MCQSSTSWCLITLFFSSHVICYCSTHLSLNRVDIFRCSTFEAFHIILLLKLFVCEIFADKSGKDRLKQQAQPLLT